LWSLCSATEDLSYHIPAPQMTTLLGIHMIPNDWYAFASKVIMLHTISALVYHNCSLKFKVILTIN
jgi:hypothetical protein